MNTKTNQEVDPDLINQVDTLNEGIKVLALNLAVYLAKAKRSSKELAQLEPDFIRLVNGTVKVVQELTAIINAARNQSMGALAGSMGDGEGRPVEDKLRNILDQCHRILTALSDRKEPKT